MADNKAKRSIHPAQPERLRLHPEPRPEAGELMPIKVHAYRTIAELNGGFEKVLQDLQTLGHINFFRSGSVAAAYHQISRIRAQVNREFTRELHDRESANAGYFDQLCKEAEKKFGVAPAGK